jgi:hypothetical protein
MDSTRSLSLPFSNLLFYILLVVSSSFFSSIWSFQEGERKRSPPQVIGVELGGIGEKADDNNRSLFELGGLPVPRE